MSKLLDLTGLQINYWKVLNRAPTTITQRTLWNCQCICGNIYAVDTNSLRNGKSKSCGCVFNKLKTRKGIRTSGQYRKYMELIRNAKRRNIECTLSQEQFDILIHIPCFYCSKVGKPFSGIDRIESKLGYIIDNCISCCWICNRFKGFDLSPQELLDHAQRIVNTMNKEV